MTTQFAKRFSCALLLASVLASVFTSSAAFAEPKSFDVKVDGLHCAACTQMVKEALAKIPAIDKQSLEVSLKKKEATFMTSSDDKTINAQIQKAIEEAGYTVSSINGQKINAQTSKALKN